MAFGDGHALRVLSSARSSVMSGRDRLENVNPLVVGKAAERKITPEEEDDSIRDEIDAREIFGMYEFMLLKSKNTNLCGTRVYNIRFGAVYQ